MSIQRGLLLLIGTAAFLFVSYTVANERPPAESLIGAIIMMVSFITYTESESD